MHLLAPEVFLACIWSRKCWLSFASEGSEGSTNLVCLFSSHSSEPNSVFPSFFHIFSISLKSRAFDSCGPGSFLRLNAANFVKDRSKHLCVIPGQTVPSALRVFPALPAALSVPQGAWPPVHRLQAHAQVTLGTFEATL